MKALSIRQPWAWAILHCGKDVENRSWCEGFTGRIYVHAGKQDDPLGYEILRMMGYHPPPRAGLAKGYIVGEVTVLGCVPAVQCRTSAWAARDGWCFLLADAEAYVDPVKCRGQLGFFEVGEINRQGAKGDSNHGGTEVTEPEGEGRPGVGAADGPDGGSGYRDLPMLEGLEGTEGDERLETADGRPGAESDGVRDKEA